MKKICSIYKSPREEEMYLYVEKQVGLSKVPAKLLEKFGEPTFVMTLLITPERQLARVNTQKVLDEIEAKGFFLQMPPVKEGYVVEYTSRISARSDSGDKDSSQ